MLSRRSFLLLPAGVAWLPLSCSPDPGGVTLQGSGATFPAPLYKRWFLEFYKRDPRVRINYQPIGSGAGIRQFTEGLTHFGASDAAMSDKELRQAEQSRGEAVLMVPMTAGSVALCYNVPALGARGKTLQLTREALAEILFGRVTEWNDPVLVKDNPHLADYDKPVTWVRRSEGSGTTYAFTNFAGAVSKEWKDGPGVGKSVSWPIGIGAKGNDGVAALIDQTPGALGYVEFGYADLAGLSMAAVENKRGRFVEPGVESGQAALAGAKMPANFRLFIPDPDGEKAYPIVTYTWILVLKRYQSARAAHWLREALVYGLTDGQAFSRELGYIPLPEAVTRPVLEAVRTIEPRGKSADAT
jgi:phosphate transport system substrate-binding protein